MNYFEAQKLLAKHFSKKLCMVPEKIKTACSHKKIRCHTISKSAALKKISIDEHVYTLSCDGVSFCKKIGVNKATIFYGFCKKHDSEIFSPIENTTAGITNKKQMFLLAYRALCLRLYKKRASKGLYGDCQEAIPMLLPEHLDPAIADLEHFKSIYDGTLCSHSYDDISTIIIKLKNAPLVMGTGFICPELDLNGNVINNLDDLSVRPKGIAINCVSPPGGEEGLIALSATKDSLELLQSYYDCLCKKNANQILEIIIKLLFLYEENIVFNISWWDNLEEDIKSLIYGIFLLHTTPESSNQDVHTGLTFLNTHHEIFSGISLSSIEII